MASLLRARAGRMRLSVTPSPGAPSALSGFGFSPRFQSPGGVLVIAPRVRQAAAMRIPALGGAIEATGTVALPSLSASGTGRVLVRTSASVVLPSLTATGSVSALGAISATGSVALPSLTASGTGRVLVAATAAVAIPSLTASAALSSRTRVVGAVSLPSLGAAGSVVVRVAATAAAALPSLTANGQARSTTRVAGSVALPSLTASGTGRALVAATAAVSLPSLSASGTGRVLVRTSASVVLPSLTASGVAGVPAPRTATAAVSLPSLTAAATATSTTRVVGAVTLPSLLVAGAARVPVAGAGAVALPGLTVAGSARVTTRLAGAVALPSLTVSGSVAARVAASGVVSMPGFSASGTSRVLVRATAAVALPSLVVSGTAAAPVRGAGAVSLPSLVVSVAAGVRVRGAGAVSLPSLTATGVVSGERSPYVLTALLSVFPARTAAASVGPAQTGGLGVAPAMTAAAVITPALTATQRLTPQLEGAARVAPALHATAAVVPPYTGTPVPAPPTVPPELALAPATFALTAIEGTGAMPSAVILASSLNATPLGALSVGTISGTGASRITVTVLGNAITVTATEGVLAAGIYTVSVEILDPTASNSPQTATGTFEVTAVASAGTIAASLEPLGSTPGTGLLQARPWPMRPGDCTAATIAARKPAVFVGGVEQAVYAEPLPGKFPDGSYRALWLPFYVDVPSTTPIAAEVRLDQVRTTTDIAKPTVSPATFWVPRAAEAWGVDADPTLALVPTDPTYLCACDITFQPLLPASAQDAAETARLDTFFTQRLTALKAESDPLDRTVNAVRLYQSTYESSLAMLATWCRTGNVAYYRDALFFAYRLLEYTNNSLAAIKPSPSTNVFNESRMASTDGQIAEAFSLRYLSYAACWQVSGYVPFLAAVNGQHMNQNYSNRATAPGANVINSLSTGGYIDSVYLPRFNMVRMWSHLIAYVIGANRRQSTQSGFGNRDMSFPVELPLIIGALINAQYAKGDYRDGLTGCSPNSTNGIANGGTGTGAVPNFQLNYVNALYMFYEREVHADPRIPALIRANTDVICANSKPLTVGARGYGYTDSGYGTTYWANPTTAGQPAADYLGYSMGSFGYCAARWPGTMSNGATYETWYQRAVDYKNIGYTTGTLKTDWDQFVRGMKILGEGYGFQQAGPYVVRNGVPAGAPQINTLPVLTDWPLSP